MPAPLMTPAPKPTAALRLVRCRCLLDDGQRCELLMQAAGTCAAMCELLDVYGSRLRRISARLA